MNNQASLTNLANQKILILGLGGEGWSTYRFLRRHLPDTELALADQRQANELSAVEQTALQKDGHLTLLLGQHYLTQLADYDLIFKAPGIPKSLPAIKSALEKGVKLTSNTQLFFELCQGKIIGVTGTKGKSTTAAVIHHVLKTGELDVLLVGNIGQPALDYLEKVQPATLVVFELSSHQLENLTLSPHWAVVQNITSEHLDYYATTNEYQQAKSAITRYQQADDLVIYDPQFATTAQIASLSLGKHLRHSLTEGPDSLAFVRAGTISYREPDQTVVSVISTTELPLIGKHNLHNVLPAVILGRLVNLSPDTIGEALRTFQPLPHRLELVADHHGYRYYNDSLATMPEATCQALENFTEPVVLIAGGYERQQDFSQLAEVILRQKVTGLVLFQPSGERLAQAVNQAAGPHHPLPPIEFVTDMATAVTTAQSLLPTTGGVMLMSPASASFGTFKDYQDRGEQFKKAVMMIKR